MSQTHSELPVIISNLLYVGYVLYRPTHVQNPVKTIRPEKKKRRNSRSATRKYSEKAWRQLL